jgi:hypothetical protein
MNTPVLARYNRRFLGQPRLPEEIQTLLDEQTTLVSYFVTPEDTFLCRTADGTVDLTPALPGEPGKSTVLMRPRGVSTHSLRWKSGPALIDDPAHRPMLYELELRDANNLDQGRALALVANQPVCEALAKSFHSAV